MKRVFVTVDGGCADVVSDEDVEVRIVDWDSIDDGDYLTSEEIDELEDWGKDLIPLHVIVNLREECEKQEAEDK